MRGMQIAVVGFILALPVAGWTATPTATKPTTAAAVPAKPSAQPGAPPVAIKRVPMSQEGNAIVARINAAPDTRLQQIQAELRGLQQQNLQFVTGGPVDIDKLDASLRRETALITELRARANDRLLMILRALPEPDRIAYLQRSVQVPSASSSAKPQGAKPVTAAPPVATAPAGGR